MATTKKIIRIGLTLSDGSARTFNVNATPINDTLTDEDSGQSLLTEEWEQAIVSVYETDDGLSATAVESVAIVTTTTNYIKGSE